MDVNATTAIVRTSYTFKIFRTQNPQGPRGSLRRVRVWYTIPKTFGKDHHQRLPVRAYHTPVPFEYAGDEDHGTGGVVR